MQGGNFRRGQHGRTDENHQFHAARAVAAAAEQHAEAGNVFQERHAAVRLALGGGDEAAEHDGVAVVDRHVGLGVALDGRGHRVAVNLHVVARLRDVLRDVHDHEAVLVDDGHDVQADADGELRILRGIAAAVEPVVVGAGDVGARLADEDGRGLGRRGHDARTREDVDARIVGGGGEGEVEVLIDLAEVVEARAEQVRRAGKAGEGLGVHEAGTEDGAAGVIEVALAPVVLPHAHAETFAVAEIDFENERLDADLRQHHVELRDDVADDDEVGALGKDEQRVRAFVGNDLGVADEDEITVRSTPAAHRAVDGAVQAAADAGAGAVERAGVGRSGADAGSEAAAAVDAAVAAILAADTAAIPTAILAAPESAASKSAQTAATATATKSAAPKSAAAEPATTRAGTAADARAGRRAESAEHAGDFSRRRVFDRDDHGLDGHGQGDVHLGENFQHALHVFRVVTDDEGGAALHAEQSLRQFGVRLEDAQRVLGREVVERDDLRDGHALRVGQRLVSVGGERRGFRSDGGLRDNLEKLLALRNDRDLVESENGVERVDGFLAGQRVLVLDGNFRRGRNLRGLEQRLAGQLRVEFEELAEFEFLELDHVRRDHVVGLHQALGHDVRDAGVRAACTGRAKDVRVHAGRAGISRDAGAGRHRDVAGRAARLRAGDAGEAVEVGGRAKHGRRIRARSAGRRRATRRGRRRNLRVRQRRHEEQRPDEIHHDGFHFFAGVLVLAGALVFANGEAGLAAEVVEAVAGFAPAVAAGAAERGGAFFA